MQTRSVLTLAGLLCICAGARAAGPADTASFEGAVTDDRGRAVAGATFRMQDVQTGRQVIFESDAEGRFLRRDIAPARYALNVHKAGFRTVREPVTLRARHRTRLRVALTPFTPAAAAALERGVAAFNADDADMAAEALEQAARLAPDSVEVRINLGLVYLRLSRPADGIRELEAGAALGRAWRHGHLDLALTLGAAYLGIGRTDRAAAWYERALHLEHDWPAALLGLGRCHLATRPAKAAQALNRILATAPESPEAAQAQALIRELEK